MKAINFRKPKYALPIMLLPLILLIGYALMDMFKSKGKESSNLEETEDINTKLPDANLEKRQNLGKFEALKDAFKKSADFSSIQNIEKDEEVGDVEQSGSLYTNEEMRAIDSLNIASQIKDKEVEIQSTSLKSDYQEANADRENKRPNPKESKMKDEMELFKMQMAYLDSLQNPKPAAPQTPQSNSPKKEKEAAEVVKIEDPATKYFNTVGTLKRINTITAILDEDVKVMDGSRIRIRLLDDIKITDHTLSKGSYIYGNVTGFSAQRVLINISSIHINGKRIKVDLSIYDNDGQEGFYVPASAFRDLSKTIGGQLGNQNIQMEQQAQGVEQFAFGALQNAYRSTTQAISRNIKKNKAKLKYNTHVYLVNNNEKSEQ